MISCTVILSALGHIGRWDGELGVDFVQGMLGGRESELVLEQCGLGGVLIRVGEVQALDRIEELLRLLDEAREIAEHGCMSCWGESRIVNTSSYNPYLG